jgi:hypothetical protein
MFGAPDGGVEGTGDVADGVAVAAIGLVRGLACFVDTLMVGSICPFGCSVDGAGSAGTAGPLTGASAGCDD